jgi:Zn-dependent peptidase ImmA (M78 family)
MPQQNVININPEILAWSRKEAGFEIDDILPALEIDHPTYQLWERFGRNVPFSKIKTLARGLQRQTAIFFLPSVPERAKRPIDNRNMVDFHTRISPETSLAIRRANRYSGLLKDLNTPAHYQGIYKWIDDLHGTFYNPKRIDREEIAAWARKKTGVSIEEQVSAQGQSQVYRMWRTGLEERLGIPVFQFKMPAHEIQGFSLNDHVPYCIVVNSKQSITGKIFTLFHELGHLLKGQAGICFPEKVADNQVLEQECNAFAGMLLIPGDSVMPLGTVDEILAYSNRLKVSGEACLRRLKGLGMIDDRGYFTLLAEIRDRVKEPSKGFGRATNIERAVNSRGQHLFNTLLGAAADNRVSFGTASDILDVKINHLLIHRSSPAEG